MIRSLSYNEDDIPPEEQRRIIEEIAREKGYVTPEDYRDDAARKMGLSNWGEVQDYIWQEKRKNEMMSLAEAIKGLRRVNLKCPDEGNLQKNRDRRRIKRRRKGSKGFVDTLRGKGLSPQEISALWYEQD